MSILISENDYAAVMENTVMPTLTARRKDGTLTCPDGRPLHYARFSADNPRGTVTILHGFTESIEKFRELTYVFLQAGLDVIIPEQRGHGTSYRYVDDPHLTHVERFAEYVADFSALVSQVVTAGKAPHYLFAHSMGGAVATRYLEQETGPFDKVVLSSPMMAPDRGGMPLWVCKALCRLMILLGKGRERLFLSAPYSGEESFADSCATSEARFAYYQSVKRGHTEWQNYSPTYRWTLESLKVTAAILVKGSPEQIAVPVRLYAAGKDTMVLRQPQEALVARLPRGELREIPDARHEIYFSADPVLHPYLEEILQFFTS